MARRARRVALAAVAVAVAVAATAYGIVQGGHSSGATGHAASALPTVTFGSYTGREPSAIVLNPIDSNGAVQDIHWTSWTATGASGKGTWNTVPTQVTLSAPVNGRFTRVGETSNGKLLLQGSSDNDWPIGASPAKASPATTSCTDPTAAALLAAWRVAPTNVKQGWGPTSDSAVTSFAEIQCWKDWVVAEPIGNGNGTFVFSRAGGLHLVPQPDLQQFTDTVCGDRTAPKAWKTGTGAAVC